MQMFIASAGEDSGNGIYRCELDQDSGAIQVIDTADDITNCLYLAQHPTKPVLYAVGAGQLYAFRIAPDSSLSLINRQSTQGQEPCYVSLRDNGRYALVVNYTGAEAAGSAAVFPVRDDGGVETAIQVIHAPHPGSDVHPFRQDASHPHMIVPTPDERYILVTDLGTDKILIYEPDADSGQLHPGSQPFVQIEPGSGPRHLAFHPDGHVYYVLSELLPLVTVIRLDPSEGFKPVGAYPALSPDITPDNNLSADIHVAPSGRFLYVSNRGHDSLTIFSISPDGTTLSHAGNVPTKGAGPRGFALTPDGKMLIVANQHTDDMYTFHVDVQSGQLTATGQSVAIPSPVCVLFTGLKESSTN